MANEIPILSPIELREECAVEGDIYPYDKDFYIRTKDSREICIHVLEKQIYIINSTINSPTIDSATLKSTLKIDTGGISVTGGKISFSTITAKTIELGVDNNDQVLKLGENVQIQNNDDVPIGSTGYIEIPFAGLDGMVTTRYLLLYHGIVYGISKTKPSESTHSDYKNNLGYKT